MARSHRRVRYPTGRDAPTYATTQVDSYPRDLGRLVPNRLARLPVASDLGAPVHKPALSMGHIGAAGLDRWRSFPRRFTDMGPATSRAEFGSPPPTRQMPAGITTRPPRRLRALLPNPVNTWTPATYGESEERHRGHRRRRR